MEMCVYFSHAKVCIFKPMLQYTFMGVEHLQAHILVSLHVQASILVNVFFVKDAPSSSAFAQPISYIEPIHVCMYRAPFCKL